MWNCRLNFLEATTENYYLEQSTIVSNKRLKNRSVRSNMEQEPKYGIMPWIWNPLPKPGKRQVKSGKDTYNLEL